MLNKFEKSSLIKGHGSLSLEKSKSQVTNCFSKNLMYLVSVSHGDSQVHCGCVT